MTTDLKAEGTDNYLVLRHRDGEAAAIHTPAGSVTSFEPTIWTVVWQGTDEAAWKAESLKAGVPQPTEE